jgi:hypothetical protein
MHLDHQWHQDYQFELLWEDALLAFSQDDGKGCMSLK